MADYFVGDLQGCYKELDCLLERVNFNPQQDQLWCVGDLIARGPDSLATLQYLKSLGDSVNTVLGNHDLNFLAVMHGLRQPSDNDKLHALLASPERHYWHDWFCQQPLLRHNEQLGVVMTHAGIYPWWSIAEARQYAAEVESQLRSEHLGSLLKTMYGNKPDIWHSSLNETDRYRFIVNAFTRMRFCNADGRLDFSCKIAPEDNKDNRLKPWFSYWRPKPSLTVIFGHWAALMGRTGSQYVIGLDTGCVWGEYLTLLDWQHKQYYYQPALS
ncbi:symmetrical bis(5'-nucleosyl)-tetraphosphatase [Idiomarina xiamenensis]|uniref:bis(5'-nucleosyl)-tetraphosphatase (symmetrical) n=1 Tax=Idiomarina xiamenensis 10-D-4 TaxID=740709 RepID=K2KHK2_9GAMM|nr:symmetrical bis(5'-nucleosyl)-tetraphosphatase [Idiomarina xiamenensis]EKE87473.1 diadenosine tetraphosphatase [Idiomarina xiamenensis 10-D-4]